MPSHRITGVILCGGESRRMGGGDKPLLEAGGRSLLQRVIESLFPQVDAIVLSCGSNAARYREFGLAVVADRRSGVGPLAGIEAVLEQLDADFIFVCPGDAPAFPANRCDELCHRIGDAQVAYARTGARGHQLFLLVRSSASNSLSDWLNEGGQSVSGWLDHMQAVPVDFGDEAAFTNINTPADLLVYRRSMTDENQDS